jgi:hypothetical protein
MILSRRIEKLAAPNRIGITPLRPTSTNRRRLPNCRRRHPPRRPVPATSMSAGPGYLTAVPAPRAPSSSRARRSAPPPKSSPPSSPSAGADVFPAPAGRDRRPTRPFLSSSGRPSSRPEFPSLELPAHVSIASSGRARTPGPCSRRSSSRPELDALGRHKLRSRRRSMASPFRRPRMHASAGPSGDAAPDSPVARAHAAAVVAAHGVPVARAHAAAVVFAPGSHAAMAHATTMGAAPGAPAARAHATTMGAAPGAPAARAHAAVVVSAPGSPAARAHAAAAFSLGGRGSCSRRC